MGGHDVKKDGHPIKMCANSTCGLCPEGCGTVLSLRVKYPLNLSYNTDNTALLLGTSLNGASKAKFKFERRTFRVRT